MRFATKRKDANRMKFSTLTKPDLVHAYEHKSKHLDWGQANAGETRHFLDWMYGINLSRALTASIKATGAFKLLSIGRVQGPALKMIVEKEKEILAFKSKPFWQIELTGKVKDGELNAWHIEDKFWEKEKADNIIKKTKGKSTSINDVKKKSSNQSPPTPFDLTTLQTCFITFERSSFGIPLNTQSYPYFIKNGVSSSFNCQLCPNNSFLCICVNLNASGKSVLSSTLLLCIQ